MSGALTPKQQRFVEEYLTDLNATAAYKRAGYEAEGHSATVNANRLLRNADVRRAVDAAMKARGEHVGLTAIDVLRELAVIGRSDIWDYEVDDTGHVSLAEGVPPEAIRAVSSIKRKVRKFGSERVEYETEIKLWDKNAALDKAGKHLGLWLEKLALTDPTGKQEYQGLSDERIADYLLGVLESREHLGHRQEPDARREGGTDAAAEE